MEDVASQWLTKYSDNSAAALAELVSLVVKSAGCSIPITEDDINDMDNVEGKLGDLQDEYQAVSTGAKCLSSISTCADLWCSKTVPTTLLF